MIRLAHPDLSEHVLAVMRGARVRWANLAMEPAEFIAQCDRHELRGLLYARLAASEVGGDCPPEIREALASGLREEAVSEMLRRAEIGAVLSALAAAGVHGIVFKGAALAYTVYDTPVARPRLDTDVLIGPGDVTAARDVFASHGYDEPPYCSNLFSQFEVEKLDALGVRHVFDVHWNISTQPVFADLLTYDELRRRAEPVAALGPHALAPCAIDALLLACVHPVMHHQNHARLLWIYDVHLLASRLSPAEFDDFARRAREKGVAAVCLNGLERARELFETPVPPAVLRSLSAAGASEPSAAYLASERRWHDELLSSLRASSRAADRLRLIREVLFPAPAYMLGAYGLHTRRLAGLLLPALYVHRNVRGFWRILAGKK